LQEDFKFSPDRKNKSLEAQISISVQKNTTQEVTQEFFPSRKNRALRTSSKVFLVPRKQIKEEFHLPVLKHKRISQTANPTNQIPSKRTNLSLNLSTCLPNVTQPTMLQTPVLDSSAPLTWGAEGIFPPMEEIHPSTRNEETTEMKNSTPCTMGVESTPGTGKSLYRDFNTLSSALNTPDITDLNFDENFEEFFTSNDFGNEAMKTLETPMNEPITIDTDFSQPEEIWGYKTFNDDDDFGICAPPSIVEGTLQIGNVEELLINVEEPVELMVEESTKQTFDVETNDVLKWIIDDQQIDDLQIFENPQPEVTTEMHTVPVNLPESSTTTFFVEEIPEISQLTKVEVKTEDLGEDEKYRKMRSQNNEASRKCRMNRKRKQQDMEEECELLQERNTFLKSRLEEIEQEVKLWKKKLLSDIKNTSTLSFQF